MSDRWGDILHDAKGFSTLLATAILLLIFLGTVSVLVPTADTSGERTEELNYTELEYQIHEEVNERRTARGLDPIAFDEDLRPVAREYSERMATEGFFAHTAPGGETFQDRYAKHGYECHVDIDGTYISRGGENLATTYYGQPVETSTGIEEYHSTEALAEGIVDGWMNSHSHRENILTEYWQNEAIGVYVTDEQKVYVTQNFC